MVAASMRTAAPRHPRVRTLAVLALATLFVAGCFELHRHRENLGGERVEFVTSDGIRLRGHLYGDGSTGVILAHMYPADQSDWTDFAMVLAAQGYAALTFDCRGYTESEGQPDASRADRDLEAAYDFIRPRTDRIFIAGASMGADAAVLVASRKPVAGLVLISTPIKFRGLDIEQAIREVHAPVLFVTSADDPLVAGESETLFNWSTTQDKTLKVFAGRAHGTDLLHGPYAVELQRLMLRFIADHDPHQASIDPLIGPDTPALREVPAVTYD
jgi:pimeloyl-ACP methyl ester carboxylesterase